MTFEELLPKELEELSEADIEELVGKMKLDNLVKLERALKKKARKKTNSRVKKKKKDVDDLMKKLIEQGMRK
jgi:hypothetical protein